MNPYSMTHLSDQVLLNNFGARTALELRTGAMLLAEFTEIDARRLYAPAG